MKSASQKFIVIGSVIAAIPVVLFFVFRWVYEPQLALRSMYEDPRRAVAEADRMLYLAEQNRFDLTDTLALVHMLEDMERIHDALSIFQNLTKRYPSEPVVKLWYAERLQQYGRWGEAELLYLELLDMIEAIYQTVSARESHVWRAREQELVIARRSVNIPVDRAIASEEEIYRKLAENAMSAAIDSDDETRSEWFEKSAKFFVSCLEIAPENHEARGAYANLLLQIGSPAESLRNYQILLEAEPENIGWLVSAAIAAGADNQFSIAERYMRAALRVENRIEWRLDLARFMSWGDKHDAALSEIDALIEEYPDSLLYRMERAKVLLNAGRRQEYLDETARLAALTPLDTDLRLSRIRAMIGMNMFSDVLHESAAILAIDPDNYEAALLRAESLLWSGDYPGAEAELLMLARRMPEEYIIWKRLAQSRLWNGQYDDALIVFRKMDPASMSDLEVSWGFAEAVAQQKDHSHADIAGILSMYRAMAMEQDFEWPVPLLAAVGRALRAMGENDAAVELLETATRRAAANLNLRLELADLLQSIGRHDEAGRQYRLITEGIKDTE